MKQKLPPAKPAVDPRLMELRIRGAFLMLFCMAFLVSVGVRLWYVQATFAEKFDDLSVFENVGTGTITASRGRIFDCFNRALADNRTEHSLFVNPKRVDPVIRADLVNTLVDEFLIDPVYVRNAVFATESTYRDLIPNLTLDEIKHFEAITTSGVMVETLQEVGIREREARVYPLGGIAGPVIGFTGKRDNGQVGLWGLESRFNDILCGRDGRFEDLRDQRGQRIPGSRVEIAAPRNGSDIFITLDADIQKLAEEALARGIENTGAIGGTVVITEPRTGAVRALVSLPGLDPANYLDYLENEDALFSSSTCLSYEPGSVMKVFTFAAALDEGIITPYDTWDVGLGPIWIGGWPVPDHEYTEPVHTVEYAIVHSSNRVAALVATAFDADILTEYFKSYGFGEKTPLRMPGEPSGDLKESFRPLPQIDLANMGFGHGIAVSPLQIAQGMSIFANNGALVPIRLIDSRYDPSTDTTFTLPYADSRQVITTQTAEIMLDLMVKVVDEGTATQAKTSWPCAGKTGTAQKINPEGGYFQFKMYATFAGFGPVPDPRYVIVVILDEPEWPYFGGYACGPIFKEIFNALMLRSGEAVPRETTDETVDGEEIQTRLSEISEYVISRHPFSIERAWDAEFGG